MSPAKLKIYEQGRPIAEFGVRGKFVLGRQNQGEPSPCARNGDKIIIADSNSREISRNQVSIALERHGCAVVRNLSRAVPLTLEDGCLLRQEDGPRELPLPLQLTMGDCVCRLEADRFAGEELQSLALATMPPGRGDASAASLLMESIGDSVTTPELIRWFQNATTVFQSAASSTDFFRQAVRSAAATVSLDRAKVLMRRDDGGWDTEASFPEDFGHSHTTVQRVCEEKRTFRRVPAVESGGATPSSLENVLALVAAPILDRDGEAIAVLYGDRHGARRRRLEISATEAAPRRRPASASTVEPPSSATRARTASSNTDRWATPSTWPAACKGPRSTSKPAR